MIQLEEQLEVKIFNLALYLFLCLIRFLECLKVNCLFVGKDGIRNILAIILDCL